MSVLLFHLDMGLKVYGQFTSLGGSRGMPLRM